MIRVAVSGSGQMGSLVVETVEAQEDMEVAGVVEPMADDGEFLAASGASYPRHADPAALFAATSPDVVVDFTNASFTPQLIEAALSAGVRPVIGTSGQAPETVEALRAGCAERGMGAVVAANFAVGAVVLMHLARIAARHFDYVEVIEQHHERKVDAPSGTAIETARLMREARGTDFEHNDPDLEHIPGGRGAELGGVAIHSVRLRGLVAHQEVIFGGQGQTLKLRHDSTGRDSFMPGVLLAVREVVQRDELIVGLEELIGLT